MPLDPIHIRFLPKRMVSVSTKQSEPIEWASGKRALIFSGIGNTLAFRNTVKALGVDIQDEIEFPDHHTYSPSDLEIVRKRKQQVNASVYIHD